MPKQLVVLSGAGISAESGIATFRDGNGLWENHKIEEVATPEAWQKNPALVLSFYNQRRKNAAQASPNKAHLLLADLDNYFETTIITQNVDDLHERAGSKNVLHLHGSLFSKCSDINRAIIAECYNDMLLGASAPDGGKWRPDIVWFGEEVPNIALAIPLIQAADILIIIGTSLQVYPAAGLYEYCKNDAERYYIDPNPNNTLPYRFKHILEKATTGMEELYKKLIV